MLSAFFLYVCSLSSGAQSDFDVNMGCRKGYYTLSTSINFTETECKKCSDIQFNDTELEICEEMTDFANELSLSEQSAAGVLTYISGGTFNCMYEYGKCIPISCPAFAKGMDGFESDIDIRKMNIDMKYGGEDVFRKFCHYHGCMSAYDKGRCSIWAGWAVTAVLIISILIGIIIVILCVVYCCRSKTNKRRNTQTLQDYPPHRPISFPQQQIYQQEIYPPQQQTYEQEIYPPQHQDCAVSLPIPSMLSRSVPGFSTVKDSTWVIPLFAGFHLPLEASHALASDVARMLDTETFTGKDASRLMPVWLTGYEKMCGPNGKGPFDVSAIVETVVQVYSLETSLYKEMRQGMEEPPAVQKLSQEIDQAVQALSSSNPTAAVPNIAVKLVMMPLMPMYAAGKLAPFAMLLDLALTRWEGPRCGRATVFHGTQIAKGSIAKRLDAYRHALANNSLVRMSRYISASHKIDVAIEFATKDADLAGRSPILLVIETEGRPEISAVSMYTGEEEVLFRTNAFMRVTGVGVERGIPAVYLEDCSAGTYTPLSELDWINLGDLLVMPPSKEYIRNAHASNMAGFNLGVSLMLWLSNKKKGGYERGTRKQAASIVYYGYNPDVDDDVGRECARALLSIANSMRLVHLFRGGTTEMPDSIFPVMYKEEGNDISKFADKFMRWDPVRTLFTFVDTTPGSADYELMDRIFKTSPYWKDKDF